MPPEAPLFGVPPPLSDLGWDSGFAEAFAPHADGCVPGRVARTDRGGVLTVETAGGSLRAHLAARFRRVADPLELPTVGDWVAVRRGAGGDGDTVEAVLPRRTAFVRHAPSDTGTVAQALAANVDVVMVVASLEVELNLRRLDRYLTLAWQSGATPVVVLSKTDACDDVAAAAARIESAAIGVEVLPVSAVTREGVDTLGAYASAGRTVVLLGPSGVGKSTLANALLGGDRLATNAVRADGKGRHTTTHRELLSLPGGGVLIDTPGIRGLLLWDGEDGLGEAFADIEALAAGCRFADCRHAGEPGCAVAAAVADGSLPADRLDSYETLQRELAHLARKQDARLAQAERRKWKAVHKSLRDHPKLRARGER